MKAEIFRRRRSVPANQMSMAAAYHYQQTHSNLSPLWRIDFVAVALNQQGKPAHIELIENAVGDE